MPRRKYYTPKTDRLNRSLSFTPVKGESNPYALLAAAVIMQAAEDCQNFSIDDPNRALYNGGMKDGGRYCTFKYLRDFINSDWIDMLLSWQTQIKPEAVCEELIRRLIA